MKELIDFDPVTGERMFLCRDADGYSIRQEHDVTPVIEANKANATEGFDKRKDLWLAARVPIGIMFEWKKRYGVEFWNPNHKKRVMNLLDDPEWRYLRVNHFIIGAKD